MMCLRRCVLLLGVLTAGGSAMASEPSVKDDLAHRDTTIHWPKEFDPRSAPVFSHNELLIDADCHRVWTRLIDATRWPEWFVLVKDVTVEGPGGPLASGARLKLKIFGSPITTRIDEFVPDSRLSWLPQGLDESKPQHYHTWHLLPETNSCRVVTEETGIGPNDIKAPEKGSRLMRHAHELWLDSLRWRAEE